VNSYFKQCFPGFQKYPDWDFLRKEVCGVFFLWRMVDDCNDAELLSYSLLG
jgi:hypothetical protein